MRYLIIISLLALIATNMAQCKTSKYMPYYRMQFDRYSDSADKYYNLWQAGFHSKRVLNKWIEYSDLQTTYENKIKHKQ